MTGTVARRRSFGGVSKILVGSVVGQGLVILASPLLTRLYSPSDFGLFAVFSSVVAILGAVANGRMDGAVPLPEDDKDAAAAAWAGIGIAAAFAAVVAVVGVAGGEQIAALLGVPALAAVWWLVPLTALVIALQEVLSSWMVRQRSYSSIARRNVLQGVGQVGTQVGLGLAHLQPVGLLLGVAAGRLLAVGNLLSRSGLLRLRPDPGALRATLRRWRRFPLVSSWSALINSGGVEAPVLVISVLYGNVSVGLLALTVRVVASPASFLGQAVAHVFVGEAAALIRAGTAELAALVRRTTTRLLAIGALPAVLLVVLGPLMFGLVFGDRWTAAGEFARWLALGYTAQLAVVPIAQTLALLERQGQQLAWDAFRLACTTGGPALCALFGGSITQAVIVLSAAQVVSYAVLFVLSRRGAVAFDRVRQP